MKKYKEQKDQVVDDHLESILRSQLHQPVEFYKSDDLDAIMEKWMMLECYNLDSVGTAPDEDMAFPWAAIEVSMTYDQQVSCFYVIVLGENTQYLYTLDSLSKAVDLVRNLRLMYTATMDQQRALEKKRAEIK